MAGESPMLPAYMYLSILAFFVTPPAT